MADRDLVRLYAPDLSGARRYGFITKILALRIKHVQIPYRRCPF